MYTTKKLMSFLNINIVVNSYDKNTLFELKNWARNTSWSYKVQVGNLESARRNALAAIDALEKEYHLK